MAPRNAPTGKTAAPANTQPTPPGEGNRTRGPQSPRALEGDPASSSPRANPSQAQAADYGRNPEAWRENLNTTGDAVRGQVGTDFSQAYQAGDYLDGAVGGYGYAEGWAAQGAFYGWADPSYESVSGFLGAAWVNVSPVYYAYGTGGNVQYDQSGTTVNGQNVGSAQSYAQQTHDAVEAAPTPQTVSQADNTWKPLGVFALTREGVDDAQILLELAVNRKGVVAGTYYNQTSRVARALKGTLNPKTQRMGIGFADGQGSVAFETGLANLTQYDEAPALIHFGTTASQPVLLVRLQPPQNPTTQP